MRKLVKGTTLPRSTGVGWSRKRDWCKVHEQAEEFRGAVVSAVRLDCVGELELFSATQVYA
jgi:hypothetical protein